MKKILTIIAVLIVSVASFAQSTEEKTTKKMVQLMWMINNFYVDTADLPKITEKGMVSMLKELDPHSAYIAVKDVQAANEPLQGNIIGIGITYQLSDDTIHVVDVVADGPSEKVGILPGDKIIKVDDTAATGDSINQDWVLKHLRGKKDTKVRITVLRGGRGEIVFNIIRDKIPLNSIDTWFMIDKEIGYISLRRYAQTSDEEFKKAVADLKSQGMKKLIFDLRSNGGGYLDAAQKIVDEFISDDKLIVYTEGTKVPRQELKAKRKGVWESGDLVVLTDEYTASASEITSGAVQDWDRGVIIGRRTFGKGLVQRPFNMVDGSQVRLTTARYYIPSGRCIQKPYNDGVEEYYKDYQNRYKHGEMVNKDSISFPDSLKFYTNNHRVVYGGGGIMPDIFVAMDTSRASDYFINLRSKNLFNEFALSYVEKNREELLKKYPNYEDFDKAWESFGLMKDFTQFAQSKGVRPEVIKTEWVNKIVMDYLNEVHKDSTKVNSYTSYQDYAKYLTSDDKMIKEILTKAEQEDAKQKQYIESSNKYIEANLKGMVARFLYGIKYYYKSVQQNDETVAEAVKLLKDEKRYKSILKGKK
jgi:carboxyl-terminal processing protease